MRRLEILADPTCAACRRFAAWAVAQRTFVPLRTAPSPQAEPAGAEPPPHRPLELRADDGSVWLGERAVRVALWAMRRYRHAARHPAVPEWIEADHRKGRRPPTTAPLRAPGVPVVARRAALAHPGNALVEVVGKAGLVLAVGIGRLAAIAAMVVAIVVAAVIAACVARSCGPWEAILLAIAATFGLLLAWEAATGKAPR